MFTLISYTFLTVLTVALLATSGDITMTWTSPILPKLYSNDSDVNPLDRPITAEEDSWIGSLINIGAMIGPFPFGFIAEKFGRKTALLAIAIPHIASYITLAFSHTVYLYYFARFLGGLAVGGGYTLLPMYVAEVSEDANRGMLSVILNIFWTFGNLIPYIIGPYMPVTAFNIVLACVPATFFTLFFIIAPETPYYLVHKNRINDAEKSLMKLRSKSQSGVEKEINHIKSVLEHDEHGHFLDIFKTRIYLKALMISLCLIIAQQASGINAVLFYTQEIFDAAGANDIAPEIASIIVGLVLFLTSFITPFVADRLGRKILLIISTIGMTIAHVAFGVFFYLKAAEVDVSSLSWLPILSLILYIIFFNWGIGPVPWTLSSELFPPSVKPVAAALVSMTCWTTSFLITKFFLQLNNAVGEAGTFWLFGGFCAAAFVFTLVFVPETKGKSFKEIQMILEGKKKMNSA